MLKKISKDERVQKVYAASNLALAKIANNVYSLFFEITNIF